MIVATRGLELAAGSSPMRCMSMGEGRARDRAPEDDADDRGPDDEPDAPGVGGFREAHKVAPHHCCQAQRTQERTEHEARDDLTPQHLSPVAGLDMIERERADEQARGLRSGVPPARDDERDEEREDDRLLQRAVEEPHHRDGEQLHHEEAREPFPNLVQMFSVLARCMPSRY